MNAVPTAGARSTSESSRSRFSCDIARAVSRLKDGDFNLTHRRFARHGADSVMLVVVRGGAVGDRGAFRGRWAVALVAMLVATLGFAADAFAAPPEPFGHSCEAQNGVLFCPTTSRAERVPTFDGVPLDVDVTLPAQGNGPFPTIVMLHGWGGSKTAFESTSPAGGYNNNFFARQGYAVVNYTARGWGDSCGGAAAAGQRRSLRQGLHPPRRHALRGTRHPVPARPARRPGHREAGSESASRASPTEGGRAWSSPS